MKNNRLFIRLSSLAVFVLVLGISILNVKAIHAAYVQIGPKNVSVEPLLYNPHLDVGVVMPDILGASYEVTPVSFVVHTPKQFMKYEIRPIVGKEWQNAKKYSKLEDYLFERSRDVADVVFKYLKDKLVLKESRFTDLQEKDGLLYSVITYKEYDVLAAYTDYLKNPKEKGTSDKYYKEAKGLLVVEVLPENKGAVAVVLRAVDDEAKALVDVKGVLKRVYVYPDFGGKQRFFIQGTPVVVTFSPKQWMVQAAQENSVYFAFVSSKYEKDKALASLYAGSTADVYFFVRKESQIFKDDEEYKHYLATLFVKYPDDFNTYSAEKQKEYIENQINKVLRDLRVVKHKRLGSLFCFKGKTTKLASPFQKEIKLDGYHCYGHKNGYEVHMIMQKIDGSIGEKRLEELINSLDVENISEASPQSGDFGKLPGATVTPVSGIQHAGEGAYILEFVPRVHAAEVSTETITVREPSPISAGEVLGFMGAFKIFSKQCSNLRVPYVDVLTQLGLSGKSYKLCSLSTGSGMLVNNDTILSNAHVMYSPAVADFVTTFSIITATVNSGHTVKGGIDSGFTQDLVRATRQALYALETRGYVEPGASNKTEYIVSFMQKIMQLIIQNVSEGDLQKLSSNAWAVQGNNAKFNVTDYTITLTSFGQIYEIFDIKGNDITGLLLEGVDRPVYADLAIGKINLPNKAVVVSLANGEDLRPGFNIVVAGYPGAIESAAILSKSETYPTLSRGKIASIRDSKGDFKMLQLDATATHGNSGGPLLSDYGPVVGILTIKYLDEEGSSGFTGGIHVDDMKRFLEKHGITYNQPNDLRDQVLRAVKLYNEHRFKEAVELFEQIKAVNPTYYGHMLDPIINDANYFIEAGYDKGGKFGLSNIKSINFNLSQLKLDRNAAGILLFLLAAGGFGLIIWALLGGSKGAQVNQKQVQHVYAERGMGVPQVQPQMPQSPQRVQGAQGMQVSGQAPTIQSPPPTQRQDR